MVRFIGFPEFRVHNELAVAGVGFACRRPELIQPLVMSADDTLHGGTFRRELSVHGGDAIFMDKAIQLKD